MRFSHQLMAVLVTFIWGTNFVFIEIGLRELPPFLFAALRFLLVAIPLIFFLPKPKGPWWHLIGYGVFIGFFQFGLMFWAMQEDITPGLASLVIQMQVFFTILLATAIFGEIINRVQWLALLICFCGLALIIAFTDSQTTVLGLMVVLLAALGWAAGNLIIKQAKPQNMIAFMAWSSLFAVPPLLAMSFVSEGPDLIINSLHQAGIISWSVVLWQTIGNTLIGYGLWNMLLNRYSAATITPWALLVPVFGMAASALSLGEPMSWWKWLAALLIMSGLFLNLSSTYTLRQRPATQST